MKNLNIFVTAKYTFLCIVLFCGLFSCSKELKLEESSQNQILQVLNNAIPTPPLDWENIDFMPTPPGQSPIPVPWVGQGSIASVYGLDIVNDRKAFDGWVLLYNTFTSTSPGPLVNPYFILYNKYRGLMRIFIYVTTPFIAPSSYLQDGISVVSSQETSVLNFVGKEAVDPESPNQKTYNQIQPAPSDGSMPLASNKWYMMQYELAYDPNLSKIPYNTIQLSWHLNYYNIQEIRLNGTMKGDIVQSFIGQSSGGNSNNISSILGPGTAGLLKNIGTGVIAGIGSSFLDKNTIANPQPGKPNNKFGLDNNIFNSLKTGISGAFQSSVGGLPGAIIGFLSGIVGGASTIVPLNFQIETEIELKGSGTEKGSLPSMPISFYIPGTSGLSAATGYIPTYNKTLGVLNITGKPSIDIHTISSIYEGEDPYDGYKYTNSITLVNVNLNKDFSDYLVFNEEVLAIADISILTQEFINLESKSILYSSYDWEEGYVEKYGAPLKDGPRLYCDTPIGVRFKIKITPKNGAPASVIVKTFKINHNWTYEQGY